jgi:hypothetical protein
MIRNLTFSNRTVLCVQSGVHLTHFLPSPLAQRYVSGVIETSLQLIITVTVIRNLTFSNRTGLCLQSGVHVTHFLPSSLAQRYVSVVIQTSLQLTITVTCDPELDFVKQNSFMSAEWSTLASLRPFLSCTEICFRVNTDISAINSYG